MTDHGGKPTILLTGASGAIGTGFRKDEGHRYALRLGVRPGGSKLSGSGGHEVVQLDVADLESCRAACAGIDVVIHLAADPSPDADFHDSLLANNITGTYNVFRAAADQGCRRVVFASSVHAIEGYPRERELSPHDPVRPRNMYGVSKCFGEATAHYFAVAEGLESVCLRIGGYEQEPDPADGKGNPYDWSLYVSRRDLNQLIVQAVERPLPDPNGGSVIVHAVSDNAFKRLDITATRDLFGYDPQDDAFRKAGFPATR
ncbi:MAG TPA: NAD(P)-dependent oxidoreductase [Thermomicrobiales bacterium]|jgi:nucleoside-diphosphate-sugar epimerase|nr:NAD(P)-dependent oxidoreductase [Thermomicrobiales bacterium]